MSLFLGIGMGPIQTGIFLSGAFKGGFERIVVAEVDERMKSAVHASGGKIIINVAGESGIEKEEISGIEIYNPADANDMAALVQAACEADEIATALPSVEIFKHIAPWLSEGFSKKPEKRRFIYTAENNNHAAERLAERIEGNFPNTYFLNTVVGKMSGVMPQEEAEKENLALLCEGAGRAHLVEEFNKILISSVPDIEKRRTLGLYEKDDLYPFEEAKLYGHNAIHFLLGMLGKEKGKGFMSELRQDKELVGFALDAFINESGRALCRKWEGVDALFTEDGFREYAEDLIVRMTNPYLKDAIERVTRDLPRKLSWDDRVTGTIRLVLSEGFKPEKISKGAVLACMEIFGRDKDIIKNGLAELWPKPWSDEHENVFTFIAGNIK